MKRVQISVPQLGLIAGTRGLLGAGLGLLLADKLRPEQRRAVGWTLAIVGAITTFPLVAEVIQSLHGERMDEAGSPRKSRSRMPREEAAM